MGRATNIGALLAPLIQRICVLGNIFERDKHGVVDRAELLRFYRLLDDGIYLCVAGPNIDWAYRLALGIQAKNVLLYIKANGAGDCIGNSQRRRS